MTAERPKVLDAGPVRRMLAPVEKTQEPPYWVVVAFSIAGAPAVDVALLGVSHSFAARGGMECGATARSARSIKRGDHASRGS